jgi:hypothetical protein
MALIPHRKMRAIFFQSFRDDERYSPSGLSLFLSGSDSFSLVSHSSVNPS